MGVGRRVRTGRWKGPACASQLPRDASHQLLEATWGVGALALLCPLWLQGAPFAGIIQEIQVRGEGPGWHPRGRLGCSGARVSRSSRAEPRGPGASPHRHSWPRTWTDHPAPRPPRPGRGVGCAQAGDSQEQPSTARGRGPEGGAPAHRYTHLRVPSHGTSFLRRRAQSWAGVAPRLLHQVLPHEGDPRAPLGSLLVTSTCGLHLYWAVRPLLAPEVVVFVPVLWTVGSQIGLG